MERPLREYLDREDVERMWSIAHRKDYAHHLFLKTLFFTGARISEITGLRKVDVLNRILKRKEVKKAIADGILNVEDFYRITENGRREVLDGEEALRKESVRDAIRRGILTKEEVLDIRDHPEYGLTPSAIDPKRNVIRLLTLKLKNPQFRYVPVPPGLVKELLNYSETRRIKPNDRIFPFTRVTGYLIVRKYAEEAGIKIIAPPGRKKGVENPYPHLFRHSRAIDWAKRSKDVAEFARLQKRLGHQDIKTTFIYLKYIEEGTEEESS